MAEGFLRALGGERFEAASAGTEATRVHPLAIRVMGEVGIDLGGHSSKTFDRFLAQPWDCVITVCDSANERCPIFPARTARLHWSFEDPSAASGSEDDRLQVFRRIRDEIRGRIEGFLATDRGASEAHSMPITTRRASPADAGAIARIYNEGIEDPDLPRERGEPRRLSLGGFPRSRDLHGARPAQRRLEGLRHRRARGRKLGRAPSPLPSPPPGAREFEKISLSLTEGEGRVRVNPVR